MIKKLFLIAPFLLCLAATTTNAQALQKQGRFPLSQQTSRTSGVFNYNLSVLNEPYADLTGSTSINNGEIWDDPTYVFEIGFDFVLNGNTINYLEFDGLGAFMRSETADPDVDTYIFPFEIDLIDRGALTGASLSPISYTVEGTPGNRIMKLEMRNAGSWPESFILQTQEMYVNFQMWLYEGSNVIEFRYGENFINNPPIFFADGGAYCGLADYNFVDDIVINPHFIVGDPAAPQLSVSDITLEDVPANGVVYRLTPIAPIEITVTGQSSTSYCNPNGSATVAVTGATEPITYLWSNGDTTQTIINLDGGTYTVTVTDALGSSASGSVTITGPGPINPNAGATDETAVDANDGTAFSAAFGGTPPYSWAWSNGETTQTITDLAPGEYMVTVTDDAGCTASETVYVNAFECNDLELTAVVENPTCHGLCDGIIALSPSGGTPLYSYIWSNGLVSQEADNLCGGTYFITITDQAGCVLTVEFVLDEPAPVLVNATSTDETGLDTNDGTAQANPTGGNGDYSYLWSNDSTTQVITNLAPGDYFVTVTDANGCFAADTVSIAEFQCNLILTQLWENLSCYNLCDGYAAVAVNGEVGPLSYVWSTSDTTSEISGLCTGIFSVTVTDLLTQCQEFAFYVLTQPDSLAATVLDVTHVTDTTTGSITISVTGGTPDYAIVWFDITGGLVGLGSTVSDLPAGQYYAWITDAMVCAIYTDTIEILDETVSTNHLPKVDVRIYPNPANESIQIQLDRWSEFSISATMPDGRRYPLQNISQQIDVSHLVPGFYILEGLSATHRFIHPLIIQR